MFASISRSWRFATTSYGILWRNKSLLVLPILATLAAGVVLVSFLAPLWLSGTLEQWIGLVDDHQQLSTGQKIAIGAISFLFYFCNYFVIVFFNSALVAAALRAIAGEPVSLSEALAAAGRRLPQIAGWAALSAVIGVLLRAIENAHEKAGDLVAGLLGAGWTVMTYFVVPTIVVDGVGPIGALKNSLSILKAQWGKALVGNVSLGLLGFLILLPVYLLAGGLVWLGIWSGELAVAVPSIAAAVMLGVLAAAISSAADMVFRSLLFNFATGRTLPPEIDADDLKLAFKSK